MKFPNLDHLITGNLGHDHPDNRHEDAPELSYIEYCHFPRITLIQVQRKLCPICGVDLFNSPDDECYTCRQWFDDTLDALRARMRTVR
jgi:hypothetical protein